MELGIRPAARCGWLGQETAGQYDENLFGAGGLVSWAILFGILVLIIALIGMFYARKEEAAG